MTLAISCSGAVACAEWSVARGLRAVGGVGGRANASRGLLALRVGAPRMRVFCADADLTVQALDVVQRVVLPFLMQAGCVVGDDGVVRERTVRGAQVLSGLEYGLCSSEEGCGCSAAEGVCALCVELPVEQRLFTVRESSVGAVADVERA